MNSIINRFKNFLANFLGRQDSSQNSVRPSDLIVRSDEDRKAILNRYVIDQVAKGGKVELHTDFDAVLTFGNRPNHVLHLLLSILTAGIWLIIWILISLSGGISRRSYHVDQCGWIKTT